MSVNDQFRYGRIPLKPLSYENRSNAQCNELIVDYGATGDYHIYICAEAVRATHCGAAGKANVGISND